MDWNKPKGNHTCIFLWSWPRCLSTAIAKCLSCVEGVQMWHEPYNVAFNCDILAQSKGTLISEMWANMMGTKLPNENHEFSNSKLIDMSLFTHQFVQSKLEEEESGKPYVFIKDMAMSIVDHFDLLPNVPTRHTFLIRHPHRWLSSRRRLYLRLKKSEGSQDDFDMSKAAPNSIRPFYEQDSMYKVWKLVQESGKERNPIIIDADDVLNQPERVLSKYFGELGIPFLKKYLTWDESLNSVKEWKGAYGHVVWGYQNGIFDKAIESSCFIPSNKQSLKQDDLTPDIVKMAEPLMPGYEEMFKWRIKPA